MKKQTVILGALAGVLGLGSLGTVKMGSNHANVVESHATLKKENKSLKEENKKLVSENKTLKGKTDSLVAVNESIKETVKKPKTKNNAATVAKINTDTESDNSIIRPFKVEVPIQ